MWNWSLSKRICVECFLVILLEQNLGLALSCSQVSVFLVYCVDYFFSVYISKAMRVSWLVMRSKSRGLLELVLRKIIGCRDWSINFFANNCQTSIAMLLLDHLLLLFKLTVESCCRSVISFWLWLSWCLHTWMYVFCFILKYFFYILIFFIIGFWFLKVSKVVKTLFEYVELFSCRSH